MCVNWRSSKNVQTCLECDVYIIRTSNNSPVKIVRYMGDFAYKTAFFIIKNYRQNREIKSNKNKKLPALIFGKKYIEKEQCISR